MRKGIFFLTAMFFSGLATNALTGGQAQNLLPNGGFKQFKAGNALPAKGWGFQHNKELKGKFVDDASFKGKGPVLKVKNPLTDNLVTIANRKSPFEIKEPGKYSASIWIKAGTDTQKIEYKKSPELSVITRTIKTNWKKGFYDKPQMLRKDWLKYEYDFYVPEKNVGKYFFRIDIYGSGTFYIGEPTLKKIDETKKLEKKTKAHLKETAHFTFDKDLKESKSRKSALASNKTELVPGFKGKSVIVKDHGRLLYSVKNLLNGKSGSLALWVKTSKAPAPIFTPSDCIGFRIYGKNELNKDAKLIIGNISNPGIYSCFRSSYGENSTHHTRPIKVYHENTWRHYVFTWDINSGLKVYLDGRLFLTSTSKNFLKNLSKIKPEKLRLLTATGKDAREKAFFDELRLFNRAMTKDEALKLYEEYVPIYPVLLDYATTVGKNSPLRVRMFHKKGSGTKNIKASIKSIKGDKLFETTLRVNKTGDYDVNFPASKTGDYHLIFNYNNKNIRTFEITAISSKSITSGMPESVSGKPNLKLIDEIDCTKNYPGSRYLDDGEVKVVDAPAGKYRESERKIFNFQKPNGFVYNFTIENPGKPHWLEIEYPDDKPRVFYVVVEQKLDGMGWGKNKYSMHKSLDTLGIANGINNPITGKFVKKRLLFWPDSKKIMVACFGYKTYPGCAGPAMKSIRLYENVDSLPRLKINSPEALPKRTIGNWNEDGGMPFDCWFNKYINNQGPSFDFWREKYKRQVQYIRFTGQNNVAIQVFRWGDLTGAEGIFPAEYFGGMIPGWASLAATIFEREKIPFYIQTCDYSGTLAIIGSEKTSKDSLEAAEKGQNSIEMMTADGTLDKSHNKFNFLCPEVQKVWIERIRFYRDKFDIYENFKGILFFLSSNLTFRNETTGYGDYTVSLFEKETGIKMPVKNKGMERFSKRYNYLKSNKKLWKKWINWRCAKVKGFLLELSQELNAGKKKNLKIILPLKTEASRTRFISESLKNYPGKIDFNAGFRGMGIDIESLSSEPLFIIEPISAPNYALLYRKGIEQNLDALWYSDSLADFLQKNKFPAMMLSRHANMEIFKSKSSAIKKYWWPCGYWGNNGGFHCFSTAMPDNKYLPQTLAWSLANGDLRHIDHGWWGNPENGAYKEFQNFYQAYRSIPAVAFKKAPGVNDPVMVRQYNTRDNKSDWYNPISWFSSDNKSGWFYLVNTQYYKTKVKITFDSDVKLTDTAFNRPQEIEGKVLQKELNPYQVICFRSDKPLNIVKVEQIIPANVISESTKTVANLKSGAEMAPSVEATLLVKKAEKLLKEKRYSALYYLTRSYSAQKLIKEAKKPVVFKASLNPDSNCLVIEASNRTNKTQLVKISLENLPKGVSCTNKIQKCSLRGKDRQKLFFPLAGEGLSKITCHDELEFEIDSKLRGTENRKMKYVFRPIIANFSDKIKIDGELSDWDESKWNKLIKCDNPVIVKKTGELGIFTAKFATKWNKKGLYLAVKIDEKDLIPAPENKATWHYDFLEIMFDQMNDNNDSDNCKFYAPNIEKTPLKLVLKPTEGQAENMASQCHVKYQREKKETNYEIFFPAKVLNKVNFKPGTNIGFALKVHNREHTNNSAKDLWGYSVSTNQYPLANPEIWNDILLSKETTVKKLKSEKK